MSTQDRFDIPAKLLAVVDTYAGKLPPPVRFRLPSWEAALTNIVGKPTRLLSDSAITSEPGNERFRKLGDRVVTRDAVVQVCNALDLADNDAIVAAFVLIMAWGSGTSNSRSLRNTKMALQDVGVAAAALRESAAALRSIRDVDDPAIADVHRRFALAGVGEPFFTKWFAFAGLVADREWQPLILDSRVRANLNKTLEVWLNQLTDVHNDRQRYVAYLSAMHRWANPLGCRRHGTQRSCHSR